MIDGATKGTWLKTSRSCFYRDFGVVFEFASVYIQGELSTWWDHFKQFKVHQIFFNVLQDFISNKSNLCNKLKLCKLQLEGKYQNYYYIYQEIILHCL